MRIRGCRVNRHNAAGRAGRRNIDLTLCADQSIAGSAVVIQHTREDVVRMNPSDTAGQLLVKIHADTRNRCRKNAVACGHHRISTSRAYLRIAHCVKIDSARCCYHGCACDAGHDKPARIEPEKLSTRKREIRSHALDLLSDGRHPEWRQIHDPRISSCNYISHFDLLVF